MLLSRRILTRTQYGWLTLGFVIFVVYGSLVPLEFRPRPFLEGVRRFRIAFARPIAVEQPSDWLANILLFIPLSFLTMGWRRVDRPGSSIPTAAWITISCAILSAALEFAQVWFPPRYTSPNDVVAETVGALIGIALWLIVGQRGTDVLRELWAAYADRNWALRVFPVYLLLLVIIHGMPFDLTLSPSHIWAKYRHHDQLLRPIPLTLANSEPIDLVNKAIINAAWFFPAGILLAGVPGLSFRRVNGWRIFALGALLSAAIELMQLLVLSRFADSTDIITGAAAVWLGWRIARAWERPPEESPLRRDSLRSLLGLGWMTVIVFFHWAPFNFNGSPTFLVERWEQFSFFAYRGYRPIAGMYIINDMFQKILLFFPLGLLIACHAGNRLDRVITTVVAAFISLVLEAGEFFLPDLRRPGVSDVFVEPFGAWLGCLAVGRLQAFQANTALFPYAPTLHSAGGSA